ncbi:MAG: hypothetical protein SNH01_08525 [Rikenellaceae bacterium]
MLSVISALLDMLHASATFVTVAMVTMRTWALHIRLRNPDTHRKDE